MWCVLYLQTSTEGRTRTSNEIMDITTSGIQHNIYRNKYGTCKTYTMKSKAALIKYLHQESFVPPKQILLKAINNKKNSTWPGFTAQEVQKYLPDSMPAIYKGHMKIQKQGIRSTKAKIRTALDRHNTKRDLNLPITIDKKAPLRIPCNSKSKK